MSVTTIANRYARALADVILARGETNQIVEDLNRFGRLMQAHAQLRDVFASPVLPATRKRAVLDELLSRLKLHQIAVNFLRLLLSNYRLHDLDHMLRALAQELDERQQLVTAEITTAREIGEREKQLLLDRLKAKTGKEVRLRYRIDPKIIGGVVTRIGSLVYDGSIRNQLAQMKQRLLSA
ncbi:MAG TPA: ATP synthase F1 subunit delta [Blastocatellia bacterium]|nr:ATP synthase F1 subunit delta [Blastocatellia bacterium]